MKKRFAAVFCALSLILGLCVCPVSADTKIFFLALNDTLPAAESQITPIQSGGWIYVPVTVFNSRVSGVYLGISYGFTENNRSLIMYNLSGKTLTFDIITGTATGANGETVMPGKILPSGGVIYIPAYPVCDYFGLSYSYLTTEYGPVLRIKDGTARLSDSAFLNSADSLVKNVRLNIYRCDRNVFLYDLSRAGFQLVAQKGRLMRFESVVQRKRATLERLVDTDSWSVFIEKM